MEMGITEGVLQAKGAGEAKALRQESKERVCSGNEGSPIWMQQEGVCVSWAVEKVELGCVMKRKSVLKALWEEVFCEFWRCSGAIFFD